MEISDARLGDILLSKEDLTKTLKTKYGNFTIKIPLPREKQLIVRKVAKAIGDVKLSSIPETDYFYVTAVQSIDIYIIDAPESWIGAEDCADDEFIVDFYTKCRTFEEAFRGLLRKGKIGRNSRGSKSS